MLVDANREICELAGGVLAEPVLADIPVGRCVLTSIAPLA
jgi:hypothetical protein